jgi:hypothetical protein
MPVAASAAGTLDQQQLNAQTAAEVYDGSSRAQTFTPGIGGSLDRVDLQLGVHGLPNQPMTVQIRDVDHNGFPGTAVLASATVTAQALPQHPDSAFVPVLFNVPTQVSEGTKYAIVAFALPAQAFAYVWWRSDTETYDGGSRFLATDTPPAPGSWAAQNFDHAFKTYVTPTPAQCFGLDATIVGTAGDDVLPGTSGADVIAGLDGDDEIIGMGGDDLICGGPGEDLLKGKTGNDKLKGNAANDTLKGGAGDDELRGGAGKDDLCRGGPGIDLANGTCETVRTSETPF